MMVAKLANLDYHNGKVHHVPLCDSITSNTKFFSGPNFKPSDHKLLNLRKFLNEYFLTT